MKEYLYYLAMQYEKATGVKCKDLISVVYSKEFIDWLRKRRKMGEKYSNMLQEIGLLDLDDPYTVEVGKGFLDTLVKESSNAIITPYPKGFDIRIGKIIISPGFKVNYGVPTSVACDDVTEKNITSNHQLTFMTQNPYTSAHIKNWEQLHNSGNSEIIVGVFGDIHDEDKEEKARQLEVLERKMQGSLAKMKETDGDTYLTVVASNPKLLLKKIYKKVW